MSKIQKITVTEYQYELNDFGAAIYIYKKGGRLSVTRYMVTVDTDDGLRGDYAPHYGATTNAMAQTLRMAPMLLERDPEHRVAIFEDLKIAFRHFDRVGIAALDTALWDLAGKKYGVSIAAMLGGFRDRLPVYASTYPGQKQPGGLNSAEAYADFAENCKERGFPAFKIHGIRDGSAETEVAIMTAVKDRVGEGMKLMTDPACSLKTYVDAIYVGCACDDLKYFWYEDPYRDAATSAFSHKRIREKIRTPLLISEHIRGAEQKADFALNGGTDIIHIDPELDGGITGTLKIAQFADAIGMDVQLHTAGPMHRHCMAAIPNTYFYELALVGPGRCNGFQPPIYACGYGDQVDDVESDGCLPVPQGPGLGVTYDLDKLSRWEIARHVIE
jgi:L-alanine-DL-glutamate epimerase-like enolase superfamily enzyme